MGLGRRIAHKLFGERIHAWTDATKRRKLDALRHDGTLLTPIDAALATLRLKRLLPPHLRALEPFGRMGYWKTVDYISYCESLDFYEINPHYAAAAKRHLPKVVDVYCEDAVDVITHHRTPRHDYNFVLLDNGIGGLYGKNYCEHFDLIPALFDDIADNAVVIANVFRTKKSYKEFDPIYVQRRREFYGVPRPDDAMCPSEENIIAAYKSRLPERLQLLDAFTVPHPRHPDIPQNEMHFVVLSLGPQRPEEEL